MHQITAPDESPAAGWERTLYAFLAEKERRSGSQRTVQSYSRMLRDSSSVAAGNAGRGDIPGCLHLGVRHRPIRQATRLDHHRREARVFKFLLPFPYKNEGDVLQPLRCPGATPARSKLSTRLDAEQIRRLLDVIPSTPVGMRDRAIILTLIFTGRRRAEVLGPKVGDISQEGSVFYSYRGKGGRPGSANCRARRWRLLKPGWRAQAGTSSRWSPKPRCGPTAARVAASPAAPSTPTCDAI